MHDLETIKTQLEICNLKARHLRLLDTKQWADYSTLLTEDFELDMGASASAAIVCGREAALQQIAMSVANMTTVHQAHMPEFEFLGDEVRVIWAMHDRIVRGPGQPSFSLFGHHHDRWVRRDGEWKLAALRLTVMHLDTHPPASSG